MKAKTIRHLGAKSPPNIIAQRDNPMKIQSASSRMTRQAHHENLTLSLSNGQASRALTRRTLIAGLGAAVAVMRPFEALATSNMRPEISVVYTCDPMGAQQTQRRGLTDGLMELGFVPGSSLEVYNWGLYGSLDTATDLIPLPANG